MPYWEFFRSQRLLAHSQHLTYQLVVDGLRASRYFTTAGWQDSRVFEAVPDDLHQILLLSEARSANPSAVILDSRTWRTTPKAASAQQAIKLHVVKLGQPERGFVLQPRRWSSAA